MPDAAKPGPARLPDLVTALACTPAILTALSVGWREGEPAAGAVAAAAAFVVGFGAFKEVLGSSPLAMTLAMVGMALSGMTGALAGQSELAMTGAVLAWGFAAGLLAATEPNLGWVAQQSTIMLLVSGAYPGGPRYALDRGLLILGGSALQIGALELCRWAARRPSPWPALAEVRTAAREALRRLVQEVRTRSAAVDRAVRVAVVLAVAVGVWRQLRLPNGYWMAMTALLLVRPDVRGTFWRVVERVAGTVLGATVATLLTLVIPAHAPGPAIALIVGFAVLTLSLQQGNQVGGWMLNYPGSYAVFAALLTAYVVFLLDYSGLEERAVAERRVMFTVLGGGFALGIHVPFANVRQPTAPPA